MHTLQFNYCMMGHFGSLSSFDAGSGSVIHSKNMCFFVPNFKQVDRL